MAEAAAAGKGKSHGAVNMDDLMNDPDLEKLHKDRMMEMQREGEKRALMQRKGHGEYQVWGSHNHHGTATRTSDL